MNSLPRLPSASGRFVPASRTPPSVGILTSFPPAQCGLATFSAGLANGLSAKGSEVGVVRVADGAECTSTAVLGELVSGVAASIAACSETLNGHDVAIIQHDYELYGGSGGNEVVDVLDGLRVPAIVVAHDVLKNPTAQQLSHMQTIAEKVDRIVVMSEAANERLCLEYSVDRQKVVTIGRGATLPTVVPVEAVR